MFSEHDDNNVLLDAAEATLHESPHGADTGSSESGHSAEIPTSATHSDERSNENAAEPPGSAESENSNTQTLSLDEKPGEISSESGDSASAAIPMEQLLDQYSSPAPVEAEGGILEGRVVAVIEAGIVVDIGAKLEGLIPAQELMDLGTPLPAQPGETIEVERLPEHKDGYALLSHAKVWRRRIWQRIEQAYREHTPLTGKVVDHIKGGLVLDIGVRAFLPASQLDLRPVHDLDAWKDREVTVAVLKLNRKRGNVVVSRRALLEAEQKAQREALMDGLQEGAVVRGKVKNIATYGVFVDLGGLDGLLHVSDLVWGRIAHPKEVVSPGDEIDVQILKFDRERMRISLGRKQLMPDPWATLPERFPVGSRVHGKVVGLTNYGAFVQVEPGVEGLVHVSEMTWSRRMKHPSKILKEGDEVEVVVLELKPEIRRISLGLKQTLPDPWEVVAEKYVPGMVVSGRVRNVTDFGAFLEIEEGIEGLIHIGDISWTERVQNPGDKFKKGERVEAQVLKVDVVNRRLSLGVKQLHDPVGDWIRGHQVGELVRGKVVRLATFGAFVTVAEGVEGLCHVSEVEERKSRAERENLLRDSQRLGSLTVGQEYDFKILKLDPEQRKISLSFRAAARQAEKKETEAFRSSKSSSTATIGEAILAKRQMS